jgi:hypothetical protein
MIFNLAMMGLYAYGVMPIYTTLRNPLYRSLIRLLLHPVLMLINRTVCVQPVEDINGTTPLRASGLVLLVIMEEAFIGRLMLFTLNNALVSFTNSMILGAIEILVRSSLTRRIRILQFARGRIFGRIARLFGKEFLDKDYEFVIEIQAVKSHYGMSVQNVALFVTAAMLGGFYRHRQVFDFAYSTFDPLDYGTFSLLLFIQLVVNIFVDYICLVVETSQGVPTSRIVYHDSVRIAIWELLCALTTFTVVLYVMGSLPFKGYCETENPCSCTAAIDYSLYPICANVTLNPFIPD